MNAVKSAAQALVDRGYELLKQGDLGSLDLYLIELKREMVHVRFVRDRGIWNIDVAFDEDPSEDEWAYLSLWNSVMFDDSDRSTPWPLSRQIEIMVKLLPRIEGLTAGEAGGLRERIHDAYVDDLVRRGLDPRLARNDRD